MRWKFEGVDFEPAGEDHSAPGSSATVGQKIIRQIFDGAPPFYVGYAFVGMAGRSKFSSAAESERNH
jgi:lysyl-tRNA synthetase, class I